MSSPVNLRRSGHVIARQAIHFPMRPLALLFLVWLAVLTSLAPGTSWAQGHKLGLLVGVGQYPERENRLEGPPHDVRAMHQVLTQRWGYGSPQLRTLIDEKATRSNILAELQALMQRSQPGDEVLIYLSGHGTSALDPTLGLPVPHGSGAFVPFDFDAQAPAPERTLLIGRTDLRPVIEALDRGGRKVWVITDSCYSGRQVRSVALPLPRRMISLPAGSKQQDYRKTREQFQSANAGTDPWPYRNVAFLSAAAEGEAAADIPSALLRLYPTFDGQPHGALTDALLRVLHGHEAVDLNGDGRASLHEIHQTVGHFMSRRAYGHSPQRLPSVEDDQQGVGNRPLLSGRNLGVRPQQVLQSSLTVAVADGVPSGVRRTVTTLPGITLSAGADADLRVVPASPPGHLSLLTRQGDLIATFAASDVTRLTGQIQQLVWAENLDSLARRGRRDALAAEIAPAALGGNFLPGDRLHFAVRPDRDATVLLLNANAEGKVSVLYPFHGNELAPLPGSLSHRLPSGPAIVATEPLGLDLQFLFAFDAPPPGLAQWVGRTSLVIGDPSLGALQDMVKSQAGRYTYVRTELRVLPPPAHP